MRTGGRTFDAAAYLPAPAQTPARCAACSRGDLDSTINRYNVIRRAETVHGNIALAAVDLPVGRVIAAQAADELLQIAGVSASFVLTPIGEDVNLSARSVGEINAGDTGKAWRRRQCGGGRRSGEACSKVADVREQLLAAIDEYFRK